MMTATCSLAKPLSISPGVRMPKIPSTITPIRKVNAGPSISVYKEMIMNAKTMATIIMSGLIKTYKIDKKKLNLPLKIIN